MKMKRLFLVFPVLLCAGAALAAGATKGDRFSNEDYNNDLMLDGVSYQEFLAWCDADKARCIREINFITFKYAKGKFACNYSPKELEMVSMGVVTSMKFILKKIPDVAAHKGDTVRGEIIGIVDLLGKNCAERLKNTGG
jgi:hypothetical protein